jgi:hypothetical protein
MLQTGIVILTPGAKNLATPLHTAVVEVLTPFILNPWLTHG